MAKIAILAGEPSGDLIAGQLMAHINSEEKKVQFIGVGGPSMKEQGLKSFFDYSNLSLLGSDVPPYVRAASRGGSSFPNGINSEGLKRRGFRVQAISDIKEGYKIIYMRNNSLEQAKKDLMKLKESSQEVGLYLDFIERSKRGLIR